MKLLIFSVALLSSCFLQSYGLTCKTLKVDVEGRRKTMTSHDDYGYSSYADNEEKCWIIKSDVKIRLQIEDFNLQPQDSDGACVDYVNIYDGERGTDDKKRLGTFCGRNPFNTVISTGDRMRVQFYSNGDGVRSDGFELKYKLSGASELDPGAYWKAGLIFLFIFVFVIAACVIAICAAFHTQKRLKPKVILVKRLKGKSVTNTTGTDNNVRYDVTGQQTPSGHLYPEPLPEPIEPNMYDEPVEAMKSQPVMTLARDHNTAGAFQGPSFTGQGQGMMAQGFGTSTPNDERVSPRARPTTASAIRFD